MQYRIHLVLLQYIVAWTRAAYHLEDDYNTTMFSDYFDFFTGEDPTQGYVDYLDRDRAIDNELTYPTLDQENNRIQAYFGVDSNNVSTGHGRQSIRLESKQSYNHGLFILDLSHMPNNACGSWPAFWMLSTSRRWPDGGEIDIIEGINMQNGNSMALHTNNDCRIQNSTDMLGYVQTANCDINASGQEYKESCSIKSGDTKTYGSGFNEAGGGVYAAEWTQDYISIWHFARDEISDDIVNDRPQPDSWGMPLGKFRGACKIDDKFRDLKIIFDVTFCGEWAGADWTSQCSASISDTCEDYVQNYPQAFEETYWLVNSLKVYKE